MSKKQKTTNKSQKSKTNDKQITTKIQNSKQLVLDII